MPYNLTKIVAGNESGLLTFVQGVNTELMGGLLGSFFLVGVSIVLLIAFISKSDDVGKSIAAVSFISFTLALSLVALDLMKPVGVFVTLIVAGIAVATTWSRK